MVRRKNMTLLIVGIVLIAIAIGLACWWYFAMFARSCNPPLPRQTITVGSTTIDVEMATTMAEQACGLSGRTGLGDGQGMLFPFGSGSTQNFWMKDMKFALDMVWISQGKVAGFTENIPPPASGTQLWQLKIYSSPPNVDTVLEVPSGTVARDNIQVGDSVTGF
jgi:uncharacterized membrane protein (UPF0127 family)